MSMSMLMYGGRRYWNYLLFLNGDETVTCLNQQLGLMTDDDFGAVL